MQELLVYSDFDALIVHCVNSYPEEKRFYVLSV